MEARRARFERLFDDHGDAVLRYARRRATPGVAEDVLAETFLVAWRRLDRVPDEALPWLLAVARRVLANQRRGERRRAALVTRLAAEPLETGAQPEQGGPEEVRAALDRLPERDREALALVHWDGLTPSEAARAVGCSALAFRSRLHRARRRLGRELSAGADAPLARAVEGRPLVDLTEDGGAR